MIKFLSELYGADFLGRERSVEHRATANTKADVNGGNARTKSTILDVTWGASPNMSMALNGLKNTCLNKFKKDKTLKTIKYVFAVEERGKVVTYGSTVTYINNQVQYTKPVAR